MSQGTLKEQTQHSLANPNLTKLKLVVQKQEEEEAGWIFVLYNSRRPTEMIVEMPAVK